MIRYRITHVTTYVYTEAVSLCQNVAHLSARSFRLRPLVGRGREAV